MLKNELATVSRPRASSSEIARQWLVKFAEVCQKDFSSALASIWAEQLCDLAPDLLERCCGQLMKKWTSGFLPVPGNIRELAEQEIDAAKCEELRERAEEERCAALVNHERAIAYAEHKQRQRLLGPPCEPMPLPQPKLPPENRPVIATRERLEELARQAELIKQKYPSGNTVLKMASALAQVGESNQ